MTNSENRKRATAIIEKILELTDEEYLQGRIDRPLEKVLAAFEYDPQRPDQSPIFHGYRC